MTTPATLTFHQLSCHKGGRRLFERIDCTLHAGRWLHVVGANGVGKTSLLRMVCGLAPIESGDIQWNGVSIHKQTEAYRRDLCYLGHLNALQEFMTVSENLAFSAALGGYSTDPRQTQDVLARFGVRGRENQLARHLSQGQKRRVALARLALSRARLWVLDEPFVAMDDAGIAMLTDLIAGHLSGGGAAVLTSHQPVAVGAIAAQILDLNA
ncbi:MAG: cytochrome c biogenesis heme-transporting ATPase CcmA [Rhodoferax sp.]|nr:cytochrome c biogenesis heme-transporting ATPase CcmA [Rhodoferax sp.]MBP7490751.1 cytochrome c biogenesis heme-transporting ATPase CcmA [Rhodoferax sp.]